MVDGEWIVEPIRVKEAFRNHFASRFQHPSSGRSHINFTFSNRLSREQTHDLEKHVSTDEIRKAVWDCGAPGPDGYTFEFFRKFWSLVGPDFCKAIHWYKVITKILANRLSSVISDLVSDVQTTFVSNRQILDGPFIINELLSWCKRKKKQAMLFKVDFAKAYDLVRWDFLDDVVCSFGFGSKWRLWISGCRSSAMASVIVNGSPTFEFQFQCGMFKGILIDNSVMISHLFYADDTVFVGVNHYDLAEAASKLGCSILKTPFKYLGVTVGSSMSRVRAWEDTLCKIKSHLSKWKTKTLLIGGRLTLLKVVLGATPIYAMSLYKVPKTVLNVMESIRSKLFNGIDGGDKKITWIKWIKVLAAKKNGGLGVSSFYALNMALLFRRVSILREEHSLKAQGIDMVSHCKKHVGDGLNTCFWEDTWMGDQPFKLMFPRIYAIESNKLCTMAGKCHPNALDQTFRRSIRGGVESQQYTHLHDLTGALILSNTTDHWVWDLNGSGDFMVKDVRSMIDDFLLPKEPDATRWIKCIPIKVNVFA
uniref:Reverse transcriptase domain-containing protein n=1 Tax=Tanacetum cinerariifolium TaxID=118510 RepID=A0A699HZJ6_TANCI|nr:hypothetical protein [Tanacetum cinerariifolium]